jgi:hypothetical protein
VRTVAPFILLAGALAGAGVVLRAASQIEAARAGAEYALVTLRYERAAEQLASASAGGLTGWLLSVLGDEATAPAVAQYWKGDYEAVAAIEDPALALLAANAEYRRLRSSGGTAEAFAARLDAVAERYAEILRQDPDNEEAAFNYEFVVRLRQAALAARKPVPPLDPAAGLTVHGAAGAPPQESEMRKFKMIVPMTPDERQEAEEAGRSGQRIRKG